MDPFERLALAAERDYLAVVAEHRSEWRDTARPAADSAVAAALTSLDAAQQEADTAAQACRLWSWLAYAASLDKPPGSGDSPRLDPVRGHLASISPTGVEAAARAQAERDEDARRAFDPNPARRHRSFTP